MPLQLVEHLTDQLAMMPFFILDLSNVSAFV